MKSQRKEIAALLVFIAVMSILMAALTFTDKAANVDFVSYWAAGQLLVSHANPYDAVKVFSLEKSVGYVRTVPLIMRNPPFALPLAAPLGFMNLRVAWSVWTFLVLCCIAISLHILRALNGRPENRIHLLGYAFAPAFACISDGQTAAFILLGVTIFFSLYRTKPLIAGLSLSVCAIKPHLLLPFAIALLLWSIYQKQYRIIYGLAIGLSTGVLSALALRPTVFSDYLAFMHSAAIDQEFVPTPSILFRAMINLNWTWPQFVPVTVGSAWAAFYFWRNRHEWEWYGENGWLLLLVSLWVSPYAWPTDEVILLPALLGLIYVGAWKLHPTATATLGIAASVCLAEMLLRVQLGSGAYLWTTTAWLSCSLVIMSVPRSHGMARPLRGESPRP
jgi:hypothetical protein